MKPVLRWVTLCVAAVCVASCSTSQRGMMAGSRMNLKKYAAPMRVGILPVSVNPNYATNELPLEAIRGAVLEQLNTSTPLTVEPIGQIEADKVYPQFPLTPKELHRVANELGFDAVIGVSVVAWSPPVRTHRARVSLVIAFADRRDEKLKWILSGTWKANSLGMLPDNLKTGLGTQFIDLKYWLKSGLLPWGSEHGSPEDPILTFYSPSYNTPLRELPVPRKDLDLVITALDDAGISELEVRNPAADYRWRPDRELNGEPIFLSAPLTVPLAFGSNTIHISARSASGHPVSRDIKLQSTKERGVAVFSVGIDKVPGLTRAKGAENAATAITAIETSYYADDPVLLTNAKATPQEVFDSLHDTVEKLGFGDEVMVMLAGRGGVSRGEPYLILFGTESNVTQTTTFEGPPRTLHVADLLPLTSGRPSLVIMDLCTEERYLADARLALGRAMNDLVRSRRADNTRYALRMSDCNKGVGELADVATDWLRAQRPKPRRNQPTTITKDLYAVILEQHADLVAAALMPVEWKMDPESGDPRYWAVGASTTRRDEAIARAVDLKARGYSAEIVLGVNGVFGVTLGPASSAEQADKLVHQAQIAGHVEPDAYVLDADNVKSREPAPE